MPQSLYAVVAILSCLLLGYGLHTLLGGLPPSLYGMIVFTLALHYNVIDDKRLEQSISWILKHMGVCFVPAGVGIIEHYDLIKSYGITMVAITFFTTWLLLTFVGWFAQKQENKAEC
ncbi:CidA/LrgA family protein [Thalassotalea sediminis]|uniref:CidA/LrgA family protein n=1 Tax=Thalassotalea sediminis TaxID=1759089 RepID=UPI002572C3E3|nr:CidA/LrgA family protein [Thalassotalea sediminis]